MMNVMTTMMATTMSALASAPPNWTAAESLDCAHALHVQSLFNRSITRR
jgi:hypothetical protein